MKLQAYILLIGALFVAYCKTYEPSVVFKVVNQKAPTQVVPGAIVAIQTIEDTTDANGIVTLDIYLDRFIVDRREVRVDAPGFEPRDSSVLVGKDQQETIVIPLKPNKRLVYVPNPVVIHENEVFEDVQIINEGLDSIPVVFIESLSWLSLVYSDSVIAPYKNGFLKINADDTNQNCRIDGQVEISWVNDEGKEQRDTLPVTKFVKDEEPPFPEFSIKQNGISTTTVYLDKEVTFDGGLSTDNCKAYAPLEFNWDFGDNNPTGFNIDNVVFNYKFPSTGVTNVTMWARDAAGNIAPKTKTIEVILEPSPPHIDNAMTATAGPGLLSVTLSARILDFGWTYNSLTDYGFVYSKVSDAVTLATSIQPPISLGGTSQNPQNFTFEFVKTGLQPTRYYFRAYAKNSGFPAVYSDPVYVDVELARFKPIGGSPGGQFLAQRGANSPAYPDQMPVAPSVTLNTFQMTETEVTNAQYAAYLNSGPTPLSQVQTFIALNINNPACKIAHNGNAYQVLPGQENYPVVTVSYDGAIAFCNFIQGRLPTEAEWEAAARSTQTPLYPQWSGTSVAPPTNHVVYNTSLPSPVKSKDDNFWELYDMSGNVAEWCKDWYGTYDLQQLDNPQGPNSSPSGERVIRGGSYQDQAEQTTVSFRGRLSPIALSPRVGFRVVKN